MKGMSEKTLHVYPAKDGGWNLRSLGISSHFAQKKQAIEEATKLAKAKPAAKVVVHERNGDFRVHFTHGLPPILHSSRKSSLGTKNIRRAVSSTIRERLELA